MSHSTPLNTDPGINQDIVIRRSRNATIIFRFLDSEGLAYTLEDDFRFILKPMAESADSEAFIDITNADDLTIDDNKISVPLTEINSNIDRPKCYYELRNETTGKNWYQGNTPIIRGLAPDGTTEEITAIIDIGEQVLSATITLAGGSGASAVDGLQDLYIGAVAMWPRTTSGCAALAKTELATSVLNIQSLDFDQTTQEFAQFTIVLPRNWNRGTVTVKVYWTAAAGTATETVQWGISGGAYSNDDALTVALGTAVTVSDAFIAANDLHVTDYTSAITLAGSPADADFLAFQISRNPGSDTLAADAKLLGVVVTLTTDSGVAA